MSRQLRFADLVLSIETMIASFHTGAGINVKLLQERIFIAFETPFLIMAHQFFAGEDRFDAVSDLFTWFFEKRKWTEYYPNKGRFQTWISTVIRNRLIDENRKRKVREVVEKPDALDAADLAIDLVDPKTPNPLNEVIDRQVGVEIRRAIGKLSTNQKSVATSVILKGYTMTETADLMEMSQDQVKGHLFQARQNLRRRLANLHHEMTHS